MSRESEPAAKPPEPGVPFEPGSPPPESATIPPQAGAPAPVRVSRVWWVVSGGAALALVVLLAVVIVYRESNKPFGFEVEVMGVLVATRSDLLTVPALVFNALGGGVISTLVVPGVIVAGLLLWRRPWGAVYYVVAALASATVTRVIKVVVARPRPEDILVQPDFGSFPSGHSANAAVVATTLGIIFLRTWVWVAGAAYTVLMMLSRTYLGAHWVSDTIGGMLVGAGVAVIVWAPFAERLYREQRMPHPPIWVRTPHDAAR
ncbi:MAG TPA: phosphatase PAP2 family protein [Agromyces mariniharenae]|nr:phosphatase PAP2 family protein [Agromyces mariniharenae]